MSQARHIVSFVALATITGRALVTFGAADGEVAIATSISDTIIGVAERVGSNDENNRCDVIVGGIAEAIAGGTITRGDVLTAGAAGVCAVASNATDRIVGIAMASAIAGDYLDVLIAQG
jgi:hypothetical protein